MRHTRHTGIASLFFALTLLSGCAVQKLLNQGDKLLQEREYLKAIDTYSEALRISPENSTVHEHIKVARREHVRSKLAEAEAALAAGELAKALGDATRVRRMPLDLEDVELVRRIDGVIAKAAATAEERVNGYVAKGHFLLAVDLSQQIVAASPGVATREAWAAEVRSKAILHYVALAKSMRSEGHHGSAAIQLAVAKRLGGEVAVPDVRELWNRFAEPTCFAAPHVEVLDRSGKAQELRAKIQTTAIAELEKVRAACGDGTRELGVRIELSKVDVGDMSTTRRAAKALPGVEVETEEVYFIEEPYTEVETYTEYDVHMEKRELRDCAPRPGKERGCSTWVEEVEVKTPIIKTRDVQKVRQIRKTRPKDGPLPEDKVLTYTVTSVTRHVTYEGVVTLSGEVDKTRTFSITRESADESNEAVAGKGLSIPADSLVVKSMGDLVAEAAEALAEEVRLAVAESVREWIARYEEQARSRVLAGQMPQAEELYLKELALGVGQSQPLSEFFADRYGRSVTEVIDMLGVALGREVSKRNQGDAEAAAGLVHFPSRATAEEAIAEDAPQATTGTGPIPIRGAVAAPPPVSTATAKKPADSGMSDDELKALEDASLDALKPVVPKSVTPAPATTTTPSEPTSPAGKMSTEPKED